MKVNELIKISNSMGFIEEKDYYFLPYSSCKYMGDSFVMFYTEFLYIYDCNDMDYKKFYIQQGLSVYTKSEIIGLTENELREMGSKFIEYKKKLIVGLKKMKLAKDFI